MSPYDDNWLGDPPEPRRLRLGVIRRALGWRHVALSEEGQCLVRLEDGRVRELNAAIREANSQ